MLKKLGKTFYVPICVLLIIQLAGCGTILHPERKGQKSGRIDVGIAVLDGIGLLFFFIPGIIAYAVDFSNGTIYLPGTSRSSLDLKDIKQVKFDPKAGSMASVGKVIQKETGCDVNLYRGNLMVSHLSSSEDMLAHFAEALPERQDTRVVLFNN